MSQSLAAPAKVNLALHVTGRRADGYHLLDTLVVFTQMGDRITVHEAPADEFVVEGPFAGAVPLDASNLVLRARDLLRRNFSGDRVRPVHIKLEKNLPPSSGIGGGSSDAAATMKALAALWEVEASDDGMAAIALELGADLPMCLAAKPLRARGIGEEITPAAGLPSLPMVLVNPGVAVSTPDIFRRLRHRDGSPLSPLPAGGDTEAVSRWLGQTRNDLEAPAREVAPVIGDVLNALGLAGARLARMSGSGATCFGLFDTATEAERGAVALQASHPEWWVVATRSTEA